MYYTRNVSIKQNSPLYPYLDRIAHLSLNLYNAGLFRERQLMTSSKKAECDWYDHEREIRKEAAGVSDLKVPASGYLAEGLPRQTAQHVLKHVVRDLKSFFEAMKQYKTNPKMFTGKPKLPGYKHKGGTSSFDISNQDCAIYQNKKGSYSAKLPLIRERVSLGKKIPGRLKEVHVCRKHDTYVISFVFDDGKGIPAVKEESCRIASIDLGVNNLMAVTNNCGLECILFNGKPLKAVNQLYSKKCAKLASAMTKGSDKKLESTKQYRSVCLKRNNRIHDYLLKSAKLFITWCVENRIDTVVIGANAFWKQEVDMGSQNNQTFVQIPYDQLKRMIQWQCERNGIRYEEQEESYTSKASFPDRDDIPLYEETDDEDEKKEKPVFKGTRIRRGIYQSWNGTKINADLNGSANILRKKFGEVFVTEPDFSNVRYILHPDIALNR